MTPEQVRLVQESFAKLAPSADKVADLFYDRLFSVAPDVRPLFPKDMREQKKGLMQHLTLAVGNLHRIESMLPAVRDLGRRHRSYAVTPRDYDLVGSVLMWTLEQGLGADFTPAVREAWREAYSTIAAAMKGGAAEAPANYRLLARRIAGGMAA
jgi:hemoglobin-like flavoprotein